MEKDTLQKNTEQLLRTTESALAIVILMSPDDHMQVSTARQEDIGPASAHFLRALTALVDRLTADTINRVPF